MKKLFVVIGIRHKAFVLADNEEEAVKLADAGDKESPMVLFGQVGYWESPETHEVKLPEGYRLVED